ncbi:MAG: hypothetical protein ACRDL6_02730 [Solirubrobacterales bacterium]
MSTSANPSRRKMVVASAAICCLLGGCGGALEDEARRQAEDGTSPGAADDSGDSAAGAPRPERARCPAELRGCRAAEGVVIFVEAVDPDGDGDAHFVLSSREGITAPGITVVDVRRDLRPRPLPGRGDRISAAGPVYPGSYGQRQIEAVVVNTAYTEPR